MSTAHKSLIGASPEEVRARLGPLEPLLCPICEIDQAQPFATDWYGFRIVRCAGCDLLYLNPRPSYSWLIENIYSDEYHHSLASVDEPLDQNRRALFERQLNGIERHVRPGRLLDVGCGQGGFLGFAARRGWQVFGTEVSPQWITGLEKALPQGTFFCGQMDEVDFRGHRFEAIRLNHVLEHTRNPARELARAAELLGPGGVVYLSVPNAASLDTRWKNLLSRLWLKRKRYRHFTTLHHLWYFTPKTLGRLANSVGLLAAGLETPVYFTQQQRDTAFASVYRALLEPAGLGNCVDAYLVKPPDGE